MAMQEWVRLPSAWIREQGLRELQWGRDGKGSDNTAALMTLTAIAHHANRDSGVARLTYDALCSVTGLSRAKLSNGLDVLERIRVVERTPEGRSSYKLSNFNPNGGYAMLPAACMYSSGRIIAFKDFWLRNATELNAMKLFFLFVALRGRDTNMAHIGYDKIEEYTAIDRSKIKAAISRLAAIPLVYVEQIQSWNYESRTANAYRIVGLNPYEHMGTKGRGMDVYDYEGA
jgi:RIO-like serine/threonine protein kinase